jgi:hypothetical protein
MNLFEKHFVNTLNTEAKVPDQEPAALPGSEEPGIDPKADAEAWQNSLDTNTAPKDFETPANPELGVVSQNVEMVKSWVHRVEEFRHFINGLDGDSLNAQINKLDRSGSVFKGLVRSEENRIIRIAEDLAGLAEVFKAYMIGSDKKLRDMKER